MRLIIHFRTSSTDLQLLKTLLVPTPLPECALKLVVSMSARDRIDLI
jgi:hypothetical protein